MRARGPRYACRPGATIASLKDAATGALNMVPIMALTTAMIAGMTAALGGAASAETTLRLNNWLPPGHSQLVGTIQPWAEEIARATEGRVTIEISAASLGAPPRQYDLAVDGIADITFGVHGYTPGRFKLPTAAELPFIAESGEALSVALWRAHEAFFEPADEHRGVVLLGLYAHRPGTIMTTSKAVRGLDDIAGLKLRVGGGIIQEINQALGGVNVAVPANEVYEVLSQGVADGTLLPSEAYSSFNLKGVVRHQTEIPGGFYSSSWFVVMNPEAFERLPEADREILMAHSGEHLARLGGRVFDQADLAAIEVMEQDGVERIMADQPFVDQIRERTAFLEQQWIDGAASLGVDGAAALAMLRSEAAAYQPAD